jgi:hypothetical protein
MFGRHYFGGAYLGGRFFGDGGSTPATGASAAAVWAYVLPNGQSAGAMLQAIYAAVTQPIEGTFTMPDLIRIIAAVQAGKSSIASLGAGAAHVEFRAVDDSEVRVAADMAGSERTTIVLTP